MKMLGIPYLTHNYTERYERSAKMREHNIAIHYTNDVVEIERRYMNHLKNCKTLD